MIALYNPISSARPWQLGAAFEIVSAMRGPDTPVIFARAVGAAGRGGSRSCRSPRRNAVRGRHATLVIIGASDHAADRAAGARRLTSTRRGSTGRGRERRASQAPPRRSSTSSTPPGLSGRATTMTGRPRRRAAAILRIGRSTAGVLGHDHVDALALASARARRLRRTGRGRGWRSTFGTGSASPMGSMVRTR